MDNRTQIGDNPEKNDEVIECMTDKSKTFNVSDIGYFFSQNNNSNRPILYEHAANFFADNPNLVVDNKTETKALLEAELAVFSGNLFRLILGETQPKYYLCQDSYFIPEDRYDHRYYRVCDKISGYRDWHEIVEVDDESGEVTLDKRPLKNQVIANCTAMLVAGHFLGEQDWVESNFGLVQTDNRNYRTIRVDPGCSFQNMLFDDTEDLTITFSNLLIHYINKINHDNGETYLEDFIDIDENKVLHEIIARKLFCDPIEISRTIKNICQLSKDDLIKCMHESFDTRHYPFAEQLIKILMERRDKYEFAYTQIKSQMRNTTSTAGVFAQQHEKRSKRSESESNDIPAVTQQDIVRKKRG